MSRRLRRSLRSLLISDRFARGTTLLFASSVPLLAFLLAAQLFSASSLARQRFGWRFLLTSEWDPVFGNFGAWPFAYGTLVTSVIALAIAVPLGVGAAVFLSELAPRRLSNALTFLIELLVAVPSVIYGLLGIFILVPLMRAYVEPALRDTLGFLPLFQGPIYGVGMLAGGVVLSIMVVPFIVTISREILLAVPQEQREGALALGATRWETTWQVVLPYARAGIAGSVVLALGRALGETMAVTMVIGNTPQVRASLFAPGYSIAAVIANEFTEATGDLYLEALVLLGLVLFALTIIMNAAARLLIAVVVGPQGPRL
jgi:phosphate transport system permease protein